MIYPLYLDTVSSLTRFKNIAPAIVLKGEYFLNSKKCNIYTTSLSSFGDESSTFHNVDYRYFCDMANQNKFSVCKLIDGCFFGLLKSDMLSRDFQNNSDKILSILLTQYRENESLFLNRENNEQRYLSPRM